VTVTVTANLDKLLDKSYEGKDLRELVDAPVSALAGVSDGDAKALKDAFNIKTVGDLGRNKVLPGRHRTGSSSPTASSNHATPLCGLPARRPTQWWIPRLASAAAASGDADRGR
jgi:hypothetical protein